MTTVADGYQAYVLESTGYDGLVKRRRSVTPPTGRKLLIRTCFASLNFRDLKILKGVYARNPQLPVVPLSDGAGQVVQVGEDVERFKVGDHVMPIYCQGWYSGDIEDRGQCYQLGGDVDGLAREYAVFDEEDLLLIPESLSLEEAATLPCAAVTAWHALVYNGRIKPGDTVLVLGSGGVSLFALQIARMSGARVIATSSDDGKLERLLGLGASDGVNYRHNPDWSSRVRDLTGGLGVDHVVEVGGADTFSHSLRSTRDGGRVHLVGNLAGNLDAIAEQDLRGIKTKRVGVGSRDMTRDLLRALDLHDVRPIIDRVFPFEQLPDALRYMETGQHFGKIILSF